MKREDGKNRKNRTGARASRNAMGLPGAGDERQLLDWSLASALASRARDKRSLRSHLFAHRLAAKHLDLFGSGARDFLSEYLRGKFSSTETTRLAGERLYRKTQREKRRSTALARLNFALSLNVTQFFPSRYLRTHPITSKRPENKGLKAAFGRASSFVQTPLKREAVTLRKETLRRETFLAPAAHGNESPVRLGRASRSARESNEVLTFYERVAREVFIKTQLETIRQREATIAGRAAQFAPISLGSPPSHSRVYVTRNAQTLNIRFQTLLTQFQTLLNRLRPTFLRTGRVTVALPVASPDSVSASAPKQDSLTQDSLTQVYVSPQSLLSVRSKGILRTMLDRTEYRETAGALAWLRRASILNIIRQVGHERREPVENRFVLPVKTRLLRSKSLEFINRALSSVRGALEEDRASVTGEMSALPRLLTLRAYMRRALAALPRRRGMSKMRADGQPFVEQRQNLERALVARRQETKLELAPVAHVFAPQQRPVIEARRVVKQVEEKEVIETIKRAVRTEMRSHSAVANFTRADFTLITDHVYDALTRRLLTEKERLGLNA